jgi:InsA C-terminal domain
VKQQIVDMAMNASGIRDTARVLHVSPVALHLTVVWMGCAKNRELAILLLAYVNAKQGGQAWTPPQHSAPV